MRARTFIPIAMMCAGLLACQPKERTADSLEDSNVNLQSEYPLLWEANGNQERRAWTLHAINVIENEVGTDLLPGSDDIESFCPRYQSLDTHQRSNFWALLISAVAKYESSFKPTDRYQEPGMGTDAVTGQHVYSEGLLQMSYQDILGAPFCEFDWNVDKNLSPTDSRKTIFDPKKNLSCGIKILARQVRNKGKVALNVGEGAYWSTLAPSSKYGHLSEIRALTQKMTGCR